MMPPIAPLAPAPAAPAWMLDVQLTAGVMLRRVIAWFIDAVVLAVILAALWLFCLFFGLLTLGLGWPLFGVLPAVPVLYHWLFVASAASATPGQQVMGLVVRRNDDLGPPGSLEALVSALLFYLTLAAGVVLLAVALVTVRHRTLHDLASGLVVVRARALSEQLTGAGRF